MFGRPVNVVVKLLFANRLTATSSGREVVNGGDRREQAVDLLTGRTPWKYSGHSPDAASAKILGDK